MNHVRPVGDVLSFAALNYEHIVFLPSADSEQLLDVKLSFHSGPGMTSEGNLFGVGVDDVHVYLNDRDFTPLIIADLQGKLDTLDQHELKTQYRRALDAWLDLETKLADAYPTNDLAAERATAQQLLATVPLSSTLNKLGDRRAGWGGRLHIFNFLYTVIEVPPISLNDLITSYNAANPGSEIPPEDIRTAIFSVGPCRLFTPHWDPRDPLPAGSLSYLIEGHYHDPLEDRVKALEQNLATLQAQITADLRTIRTALSPAGQIQTSIGNAVSKAQEAVVEVQGCRLELDSQEQQIHTLAAAVRELRDAVGRL